MNHNIWKIPTMLWFINTTDTYLFVKKKVFSYSELHFSEGTSFKIHTLDVDQAQRHLQLWQNSNQRKCLSDQNFDAVCKISIGKIEKYYVRT